MPTKDEIVNALDGVVARVQELAPKVREKPNAKLPEGDWVVRDALCHLAARSNSVPMVIGLAERVAQSGGGGFPAGFDIDAVNQEQIEERRARTVDELINEIIEGHAVAKAEVRGVDDGLFERRLPNPRGEGELALADFLFAATAWHDNMHLDDIAKAVDGA
ncbi:MAG TPA: DinB family protein [Dehalococcoidia bacterium]|nr:DinB family protein [Dehalococcoidia bacterium]